MSNVKDITQIVMGARPEDIALITRAYNFSQNAHQGQERFSGEPYFTHAFEVGKNIAEMNLDASTIAAGLLHDVCEDGHATEKEIEKEFGADIAFLVRGVTKLGKLKYRGEERYRENLRKMVLAMAEDIRVVLIKLADRLHNMQTLAHVPAHKRKRIADETLEIYAPLADRLGMGKLKNRLENLAFPFSFLREYDELKQKVAQKTANKETYLAKVKYKLTEVLKKENVAVKAMDSRVKNLYSLHKKLQKRDNNLDEIYDLVALRIIVESVGDCYATLGIIHKLWKPLPGKIKDYIALPKPNGYQSVHTTVFCIDGEITEFQIRTQAMHEESENGIAAHWAYEDAGKPAEGAKVDKKIAWIAQIRDWQKEIGETKEFVDSLKIDIFKNRIFVFTPKGDVIDLPDGATPVDFAYHVHSEIGNHTNGAKVNGKMVPLDYHLKNGELCDIITQKNKKPTLAWLDFVKTNYAKSKIRGYLKK